jgi:hypothetical protein
MSPRLLRLLLAFALALAVPLQGLAATSAGLCMALGHHDAGVTHSHDADAGAGHHHNGDEPSAAHCPPCVACCAAAAISSSGVIVTAEEHADGVIAAGPPSFSGIQPDTLDRPPLAL